jgi:hypothetical protein
MKSYEMPPKRLSLRGLGEFHYKWGKLWAYSKSRTLSRLITDVFEARLEANLDLIKEMLNDIAQQRGITVDELIEEILNSDETEL